MALNEHPAPTIKVSCSCGGRNSGCVNCRGTGSVTKFSCRRCGGTGRTGGTCVDCRGFGYREIDNDPFSGT